MNEVSQGVTGNMEYVEFVVIDTTVSYDCTSGLPPSIDIRGWIFDDNSGYHGAGGIAAGAIRFSFDPMWATVPLGTIILIYNGAQREPSIPTDDISMADGNCTIIVPVSNVNLFESNATTPGALACSYPATGWTPGGNWNNTLLANSGDCARIVNLAGCEVFSVCYGTESANTVIYFAGNAGNTVYYFNGGDPEVQANWSFGCTDNEIILDANTCGSNDQTPGLPNNAANAAYIAQFNNGCMPIPSLVASSAIDNNEICGCDGQLTASASGSIAGYTYEWLDNANNPIGQSGNTATGLCAGTYKVVVTSSIGCTDTNTIIISPITTLTYSAVVLNENCETGDGSIDLSAMNGNSSSYLYSIDGGITFSASNTFSNLAANNYTIVIEDALGCQITGVENISTTAATTFSVSPTNPTTCSGIDGTLLISGLMNSLSYAVTYTDDGSVVGPVNYLSNGSGTITIVGLNVGTYSDVVVVNNSNGCGATVVGPFNLTAPSSPVLVITNPPVVCAPTTVDITNAAITTGSTNVGVLTYWMDAAATVPLLSPTTVSVGNTYYIQASNSGCTDIEGVIVAINNPPIITNPGPQIACDSYNLGAIAGSNLTGNQNYFNNSQALGGTIVIGAINNSQTIWIYDTDGVCSDEEFFSVTINPLPAVTSMTGGGSYCIGDPLSNILVSVSGSPDWTIDYTLNGVAQSGITGSTSPISLGNAVGTYVLTGVSDVNCSNTAAGSQSITVNSYPLAPNAGTDTTYCSNWNFELMTATGVNGTLSWYLDSLLSGSPTTGSTFMPLSNIGTSSYYVTETIFACEGPASIVTITIENCNIIVPTAFTPDGDNTNDVWNIVDLDAVYPENVVTIYNRWGNKLFESEKGVYAYKPWDGKYKGDALPVGSYYFIIDFNEEDMNPMKGIVSIILE